MFINDMFNKKNINESEDLKSGDKVEVTTSKGRTYQGTFDRKNDNGSVVYRTTSHEPNVHSSKDKGTEKTHVSVVSKKHLKSIKKIDEAPTDDPKFQQMMGKVAQQKTPQQHIEDLQNVLYELEAAARNLQGITRQIKYDDTVRQILAQATELITPFKSYIEDFDIKDAFDAVYEANNQLESAIYSLDDLLVRRAKYTIEMEIEEIQDNIDYPDDDNQQLGEGLYPGEYYTYLVTFDDGTSEKLNFSSDDIDWDRVGAKRNKNVVNVKQMGGIQGEPQNTPSKPHDFPDDRGLARAQRAYDRKIPEEQELDELSKDTIKSYVPKRIDAAKAMARTNYDKAHRITKKDLPRALRKLKDPEYGKEGVEEATNDAQRAAIAISMKKAGKKPKVTNEDIDNYVESMQRHGYESVEEQKCPECGGVAYSDKMIAEEKDACYHKVKSRYKIWPSAYASGALVKCRKAGAKNWGNKSKK
jgi:hypothetical protein